MSWVTVIRSSRYVYLPYSNPLPIPKEEKQLTYPERRRYPRVLRPPIPCYYAGLLARRAREAGLVSGPVGREPGGDGQVDGEDCAKPLDTESAAHHR